MNAFKCLILSLVTAVTAGATTPLLADDETHDVTTQSAAEAAQRQHDTGTTNKNEAGQLKEIAKQEKEATQPAPKESPSPSPPKN